MNICLWILIWMATGSTCRGDISTACPITCTGTLISTCHVDCNTSKKDYILNLSKLIGQIQEPSFLSISNVSLHVLYNVTSVPGVSYMLQWRYLCVPNNTWIKFDRLRTDLNFIEVNELRPYTAYKFRIVAVAADTDIVYSPLSQVIKTLPYGAPTDSPSIVSLTSPSPTVLQLRWEHPVFVNAELVAYRLHLQPFLTIDTRPILTEPRANTTYFRFGSLLANTLYQVTISSVNRFGEGPSVARNISTLPEIQGNQAKGYLVFYSRHRILRHKLTDILDDPEVIYVNNSAVIQGITSDAHNENVYFSNSDGLVQKMNMFSLTTLIVRNSSQNATALSYDWLFHVLYIVEGNSIVRCSSEDLCLDIVNNLTSLPACLVADPVNGYLFWSTPSKGIYRVDLAFSFTKEPELVLSLDNVYSFVVDYLEHSIYFANVSNNCFRIMDTDGSDQRECYGLCADEKSSKVYNIAKRGRQLYWMNGTRIMSEEFDFSTNKYRRSYVTLKNRWYSGITIVHLDAQPIPALVPQTISRRMFGESVLENENIKSKNKSEKPQSSTVQSFGSFANFHWYTPGGCAFANLCAENVAPTSEPTLVQAVFTSTTALITWDKPTDLSKSGKGAFCAWKYSAEVRSGSGDVKLTDDISATTLFITQLSPNTTYSVRVRAYSEGGTGIWSHVFRGITMNDWQAFIVYSELSSGLLFNSSADGRVVNHVIRAPPVSGNITEIIVASAKLILLSGDGFTHMYFLNSNTSQPVMVLQNASCIAYDRAGQQIIWTSKHSSMILKTSVIDFNTSLVINSKEVKSIAVDSPEGIVYWSSSKFYDPAIYRCYLNGDERSYVTWYRSNNIMSTFHDMTIDDNRRILYWVVSNEDYSFLFSSKLGRMSTDEHVVKLKSSAGLPSLRYLNNHLYYMHNNTIWVTDTNAHFSAKIYASAKVSAFDVFHENFIVEDVNHTINVHPCTVPTSSIKILGNDWSNFSVGWREDKCVTHGEVLYYTSIKYEGHVHTQVTSYPYVMVDYLKPFSSFAVHITPSSRWVHGPETVATLCSPMSTPSHPRNLRGFKTRAGVKNRTLTMDVRWDSPSSMNGELLGYSLHFLEDNNSIYSIASLSTNKTRLTLEKIFLDRIYFLKVTVCNAKGCMNSSVVTLNTSELSWPPEVLIADGSSVSLLDTDLQKRRIFLDESATSVTYLAHEEMLFWFTDEGVLGSSNFSANGVRQVLREKLSAKGLVADWIGMHLFWIEDGNTIVMFDLSKNTKEILLKPGIVNVIQVSPFESTLFWSGDDQIYKTHIQTLKTLPLLDNSAKRGKRSVEKVCNYTDRNWLPWFAVDTSDIPAKVFLISSTHYMWLSDGYVCRVLSNISISNGSNVRGIVVDKVAIYLDISSHIVTLNKDAQIISLISIDSGSFKPISLSSFDIESQPMPDMLCLMPANTSQPPVLEQSTSTTLTLQFSSEMRPPHCKEVFRPSTLYTIYYIKHRLVSINNTRLVQNCTASKLCNKTSTYDNRITIQSLEPYTEYLIHASTSNWYSAGEVALSSGRMVVFKTETRVPSEPRDVFTHVKDPFSIKVIWKSPRSLNDRLTNVGYRVIWRTKDDEGAVSEKKSPHLSYNLRDTLLSDLVPARVYIIQVLACNTILRKCSESRKINTTTYAIPNKTELLNTTSFSLILRWTLPEDRRILNHSFLFGKVDQKSSYKLINSSDVTFIGENSYKLLLFKLEPRTRYAFQIRLTCSDGSFVTSFTWPSLPRQITFRTSSDVPPKMKQPKIQSLEQNVYSIQWNFPELDDDKHTSFLLQARNESGIWAEIYNGKNTKWRTDDLPMGHSYVFRVAAVNELGRGEFSDVSQSVLITGQLHKVDQLLSILIPILVVFGIAIAVVLKICCVVSKRRRDTLRAIAFSKVINGEGEGTELTPLASLPNMALHGNTLYPFMDGFGGRRNLTLRQIPRKQITLRKYLGCGAFGDVFEGLIKSDSQPTKVAIKLLRKGATLTERQEFLKEAMLMSNFDHEHILKIIGVCLEKKARFIILELMNRGDLLRYLRSSRERLEVRHHRLTLLDLVDVCTDVVNGCAYLEAKHYVHRDIAARNCLVSVDEGHRVVKIGDFGLARDIYKSDYYRKEGMGLLPVRWMSPESLCDGIFTTQSDVWAYGVLCWEVMTMGQQPYQARTNVEVLQFVRHGGILEKPDNCPSDIFRIMLKCWEFEAHRRASFSDILTCLEEFRETIAHSSNQSILSDLDAESSPGGGVLDWPSTCDQEHQQLCSSKSCDENFPKSHNPSVVNRPPKQVSSCPDVMGFVVNKRAHPCTHHRQVSDGYLIPNCHSANVADGRTALLPNGGAQISATNEGLSDARSVIH